MHELLLCKLVYSVGQGPAIFLIQWAKTCTFVQGVEIMKTCDSYPFIDLCRLKVKYLAQESSSTLATIGFESTFGSAHLIVVTQYFHLMHMNYLHLSGLLKLKCDEIKQNESKVIDVTFLVFPTVETSIFIVALSWNPHKNWFHVISSRVKKNSFAWLYLKITIGNLCFILPDCNANHNNKLSNHSTLPATSILNIGPITARHINPMIHQSCHLTNILKKHPAYHLVKCIQVEFS